MESECHYDPSVITFPCIPPASFGWCFWKCHCKISLRLSLATFSLEYTAGTVPTVDRALGFNGVMCVFFFCVGNLDDFNRQEEQ